MKLLPPRFIEQSGRCFSQVAVGLLFCMSMAGTARGASVGVYFGSGSSGAEIRALDLVPGQDALIWRSLGLLEESTQARGLTAANDLLLYALLRREPAWTLDTVDLETGLVTTLATLPLSDTEPGKDLALDDQGRLWTVHQSSLYEINNDGTLTAHPITADPLYAVDAFDGQLYGIVRPKSAGYWLVELNPSDGSSTALSVLQGVFECPVEAVFSPISMAFTPDGELWVPTSVTCNPGGIVPVPVVEMLHFTDPLAPTSTASSREIDNFDEDSLHIAIVERSSTVEVPGLRSLGGVALILLLTLAAWARLRGQ